jgi:hypothetical protein
LDNIGRFKPGTVFKGNINGVQMVVIKIQKENLNGCNKELAVIKDMTTEKTYTYGLRALERCNVTILK